VPRTACRLLHDVTEVRCQRLQDITEADALAEGVGPLPLGGPNRFTVDWDLGSLNAPTAREVYLMLWDAINGEGSAEKDPWVWAISFKPVTA